MKKNNYHYNQNSRRRPSLQDRLNRAREITNLYNPQNKFQGLTLEDIGKLKGLTRERIRQILFWYKKYKKVETK